MMRIFLLIMTILSLAVAPAGAQTDEGSEDQELKKHYLYEWTDDKGVPHITDGLGKVPERYRSKARKVESPTKQEAEPERQLRERSGSLDAGTGEADAAERAEWQRRVREWKQRLANAEQQYGELTRNKDDLFRKWGSPALAPPETRLKAEEIDQQMKDVREEMDNARAMIETVIPEEARKAGVPPGWLRE
jgi:hypothetical protein